MFFNIIYSTQKLTKVANNDKHTQADGLIHPHRLEGRGVVYSCSGKSEGRGVGTVFISRVCGGALGCGWEPPTGLG